MQKNSTEHNSKSFTSVTEQHFAEFYDQYAPAVYGYIKKILLKEEIANETLLVVLQQAWNSLNELEKNNLPILCQILKIARKETNKQRINIALKQIFAVEKDSEVTVI